MKLFFTPLFIWAIFSQAALRYLLVEMYDHQVNIIPRNGKTISSVDFVGSWKMTDEYETDEIDCWRIAEKIFECEITDDKGKRREKFTMSGKNITSVIDSKTKGNYKSDGMIVWNDGMFGLNKLWIKKDCKDILPEDYKCSWECTNWAGDKGGKNYCDQDWSQHAESKGCVSTTRGLIKYFCRATCNNCVTKYEGPCKVPWRYEKHGTKFYKCTGGTHVGTYGLEWCPTAVNDDLTYKNWKWCGTCDCNYCTCRDHSSKSFFLNYLNH